MSSKNILFLFSKMGKQLVKFISLQYSKPKNSFQPPDMFRKCSLLPASQVSTATLARPKYVRNLRWQGLILGLRPAVEWTVPLFPQESQRRGGR